MAAMQSFWDRRAAELCGGTEFTKNHVSRRARNLLYGCYGGAPVLEGFLDCKAAPAAGSH